jgi:type I restriction enzyme, S subunit
VRQFAEGSGGAIQQHFNVGTARDLFVATPPVEEQQAITSFLEKVTGKIDQLVLEAERAMALQEERRAALISAAVTGKIDVRGLVPQGAEAA